MVLRVNDIYPVKLCSGEVRRWKYLGQGAGERIWWCDVTTGSIFNEESILYTWEILENTSITE